VKPPVALESTVIAHGLPAPHNLETAQNCEAAVRQHAAQPLTIGIVDGQPVIGLSEDQLAEFAAGQREIIKVNPANLAGVIARGQWGATTVAATLQLARGAGLRVFATGGIGGVHRGAGESFDISADLQALATFPLITVCAGAKAILDLPKTMEVLETLGVPVIGWRTDELPAFYSRTSGIRLELWADNAEDVATIAKAHWQMGSGGGLLVVAPAPEADELPAEEVHELIEQALAEASAQRIGGKAVTPFLLSHIAEKSNGRALRANKSLLKNNASVAAEIACALYADSESERMRV
jgi:pseudouridine-5'-phosphate glycosidase